MSVFIKGVSKEDIMKYLSRGWVLFDSRDIIEVNAPHGRLIDADELEERANYESNGLANFNAVEDFSMLVGWLAGKSFTIIDAEDE